jgi:hypothetical protein
MRLAGVAVALAMVLSTVGAAAGVRGHDIVYLGDPNGNEASEFTVTEGDLGSFTINRNPHGFTAGEIDYATSNGTATASSDYTARSGTRTLQPIDTAEVDVPTIEDGLVEPVETFNVALSNPRGAPGMTLGFPRSGTFTVVDDDGSERISFTKADYENYENRDFMVLTVARSGALSATASVSYQVVPGSATAGVDYEGPLSGTVTFAGSERIKRIRVGLVNDGQDEATETFTVQLSGSPLVVAPATATAEILDTDSRSADRVEPKTVFHVPRHNKTYGLRHYVRDEVHISPSDGESGVDKVVFALRKKLRSGACSWYNLRVWVRRSCADPLGSTRETSKKWNNMRVPRDLFIMYFYQDKLKPTTFRSGIRHYTAYAKTRDHAGNGESQLVRGRNKNTFKIK